MAKLMLFLHVFGCSGERPFAAARQMSRKGSKRPCGVAASLSWGQRRRVDLFGPKPPVDVAARGLEGSIMQPSEWGCSVHFIHGSRPARRNSQLKRSPDTRLRSMKCAHAALSCRDRMSAIHFSNASISAWITDGAVSWGLISPGWL